jgi:hypothetical protein
MTRNQKAAWSGILLFVALTVAFVLMTPVPTTGKMLKLPDGVTMQFVHAHVGTIHRRDAGFAYWIRKTLPNAMLIPLGIGTKREVVTPVEALGIWFEVEGTNRLNYVFTIIDDFGVEARVRNQGGMFGSGNLAAACLAFHRFPKSSSNLTLRVANSYSKELAQISFPNPSSESKRSSIPKWVPEPIPITMKHGDIEFTMTNLSTGVRSGHEAEPAGRDERAHVLAEFMIHEQGKVLSTWQVMGVSVSDASGNEAGSNSSSPSAIGDSQRFLWHPGLWGGEAWRLRFEFARRSDSTFQTHELLQITDIAIPAAGDVTLVNVTNTIQGHRLRIVGIAMPNAEYPDHRRLNHSRMSLDVKVYPPLLDKRIVLIQVMDDQGKKSRSGGWSASRTSGDYAFGLRPNVKSKTLSFTLAVHSSVYLEYQAQPTPFQRNTEPEKNVLHGLE